MKLLSDLYNVTLKRGIRGKASEGFVRPTIGENFMSHRDFKETISFTATGGIINELGGYKIHTFTSSGTFNVMYGSKEADILVVGGGGSGGKGRSGGGVLEV